MSETVVQNGSRVVCMSRHVPRALGGLVDRTRDRSLGVALPPLQRTEPYQGIGREVASGCLGDAIAFCDERRRAPEVADPEACYRCVFEEERQLQERQLQERAGVA